ncbi:SusC/RagA family TonB-linked outer membrane protein [Yeosuana aromativorans]|uniref:SusC/RagA family TonB-linked outer membrane protein n=1 Tax=Yeosuana aromativorans TaxID=288019 RepID=A0A8J3FH50_9FLAO|nr:TonB-dependent receptor [Yeosuana aromativorans]GGK27406.1 SusC/RagA family TonB-linked outer membrane protein [Yeosuana aromativorans]
MKTIFLFVLLWPLTFFGQQLTVKGSVLDEESKQPLPGVSVVLQGTNKGAVTDFDGKFEIEAKKGDQLIFSYVGMKSQVVTVTKASMEIYLQTDISQLDEVVVSVGYFDVSKKDLSGSISQVNSEELEKSRTNSIEQMLQGQVAGVVVSESSEPGGGVAVSVRGTNSMLGGTQPLYVIDGIPIDPLTDAAGNGGAGQSQSSLSFLNPNDIEKMEVLKDAAATAVYGARGANGVILITTKSGGKDGGTDSLTLTVDSYVTDVVKNLDVMDGPLFENYMNQRAINQLYLSITNPARLGGPFDGTQQITEANYPELATFNLPYPTTTGVNNNWQDLTYRLAFSNAYNLSYRGGDKDKNLLISLGLQDVEGVIINTGNKRVTFNTKSMKKAFNKKVDLYSNTNLAYNKGNASSIGNGEVFLQKSVTSQALQFQPIFSLLSLGEDDEIYADLNEGNVLSNPYTLAKYVQDRKESFNFIQNMSLTAKLTPKLTGLVKGAFNYQKSSRDSYYPTNTTRGRRNNGEASQAFIENKKIYAETSLRYRNNFNGHHIDAILVGTYEKNNIRSMFNKAYGFGNDATSFYTFESATDILVPISQFREFGLLSGLFRVGYNYKGKYYVDVNTRIDASSKFAQNNKSAIFPSVALAWAISKEKFLKKSETVSNLKLRLSYGKTGSNPIAPYQSLALLTPIRYNFNNQLVTGYYESNLANDDLTWETTDQFNAGLDIGLLQSKINITFDAYRKLTYDLLQNVLLPASNGFASRVDNFGKVENKGIEIGINAAIFDTKKFGWDVSGNFSLNRNKLVKLNSNLEYQLGPSVGFSQTNPIMFMEGKPLGIFWGAQTNGIYQDWDEAVNSGIESAAPGEIKYINNHIDLDSNGQPLATQQINFEDYVQIGDPNPDYNVSITNNFRMGNWDLSILFTGQKGGDIFWVDSWQLTGNQKSTNGLASAFNDSWKAPLNVNYSTGEVLYDPSAGNTVNVGNPAALTDPGQRAIASDRQVFDGSYIRLKNLNIGYTVNFKNSRSLRLYGSAQNLVTWTKYPGYDPEVQTFNKDPQRRGVDFGGYPGTRTYSIGLKFNY